MSTAIVSAETNQLISYTKHAASLNTHLRAEASRLGAALDHFAATCTEYRLGIDESMAADLNTYVARIAPTDDWVGQVGSEFRHVDSGTVTGGAFRHAPRPISIKPAKIFAAIGSQAAKQLDAAQDWLMRQKQARHVAKSALSSARSVAGEAWQLLQRGVATLAAPAVRLADGAADLVGIARRGIAAGVDLAARFLRGAAERIGQLVRWVRDAFTKTLRILQTNYDLLFAVVQRLTPVMVQAIKEAATQYVGYLKGMLEQGWDMVVGIWDDVTSMLGFAWRFIQDPRGTLEQTYTDIRMFIDMFKADPLGVLKQIGLAYVEPIIEDWRAGRYGEAIGRAVFEIGTWVLPAVVAPFTGGGSLVFYLLKAQKVLRVLRLLNRLDVPSTPRKPPSGPHDGLPDGADTDLPDQPSRDPDPADPDDRLPENVTPDSAAPPSPPPQRPANGDDRLPDSDESNDAPFIPSPRRPADDQVPEDANADTPVLVSAGVGPSKPGRPSAAAGSPGRPSRPSASTGGSGRSGGSSVPTGGSGRSGDSGAPRHPSGGGAGGSGGGRDSGYGGGDDSGGAGRGGQSNKDADLNDAELLSEGLTPAQIQDLKDLLRNYQGRDQYDDALTIVYDYGGPQGYRILYAFDTIADINGSDNLWNSLHAEGDKGGFSTTEGALAELTYVAHLRQRGAEIERVSDFLPGLADPSQDQAAADIVLRDRIIDVKKYDWSKYTEFLIKMTVTKFKKQAALHRSRYPGREIEYAFTDLENMPQEIKEALEELGVDVTQVPSWENGAPWIP